MTTFANVRQREARPAATWLGVGNHLKSGLLLGGLTALAVVSADLLGGHGWGLGVFVMMGAMNFASWFWSDRIVLAMHRARPLDRHEAPHVHAAVERLAYRAGIPKPRVFFVPDPSPNAFATGRGPRHAVVAVTGGLLQILERDELEGVIAHELAHVLNRDVLTSTIAATLAGAVSLLARVAGFGLMFGGHSDDESETNPLAALALIIVAPIMALIIQLAVSRSREFGADAMGAHLSGRPDGLASALLKIDAYAHRVPMSSGGPATAHMYIQPPVAGGAARLMHLLSTHPPVEERVRRLMHRA